MVIPVGERYQQMLYLMTKRDGKLVREKLVPTLFVPMTGTAEAQREKKPDPAHPELVNGNFEESLENSGKAAGWHYQRQLKLIDEAAAPAGARFARFSNNEPGLGAQALQGLPTDGQKIKQLRVSLSVRGQDIRPGRFPYQKASLAIVFYDVDRKPVAEKFVGPWSGTFPWRRVNRTIDVPTKAHAAILRIGLFGATGQLDFDDLKVEAEPR